MRTRSDLSQMQALPLHLKIRMTQERIRQWVHEYGTDGVFVSFSGGKDSTVLLDLVRQLYPDVPAVFVDVPTQYPELREFAKTFPNVEIIRPKISFAKVCEKYGFPMISKEVSECVQGARKYLTKIAEETQSSEQSRAEQSRAEQPYKYWYERVSGTGKYARGNEGGADRKYRRLNGLLEFSKPDSRKGFVLNALPNGETVRTVSDGLGQEEGGGYP